VRGHLEILDHHAPRYAAAYRALSLEALALAAPRLDDEAVAALHELLGPFPGQAGGSAAYAVPTTPTASANQLATQQDTVDARARVRSTQDVAGMAIARTAAEMRAACAALPRPLGFVPTMGALHEGHLELVRSARRRCAAVVASVFVNPRQFGAEEDFAVYPRCETRDFDLLREEGVAVVFAPATDDVYPEGFATAVHVTGPLSESFEGAHRPGHFAGVATVVVKLLHVAQPDTVFLGEKDAQQLALLRQMVRDLDLPVAIVGVPTVREPDGLAMSSRNRRLKPDERRVAPRVHAALRAGRQAAQTKSGSPAPADVVIAAVRGGLRPASPGEPAFSIDYIDVVAPNTFERLTKANGDALIVAAARLGTVRLIDNLRVAGPRTNHEARDKSRARKNLSQRPGG
jgi:pantoate--beta-alanine ligase